MRHGIREKEDGTGTVTISTREYSDRIEVAVEDDGNGFDTKIHEDDDDQHIGIRNVAGGSLTINSVVGKGTSAVISIPKEKNTLQNRPDKDIK